MAINSKLDLVFNLKSVSDTDGFNDVQKELKDTSKELDATAVSSKKLSTSFKSTAAIGGAVVAAIAAVGAVAVVAGNAMFQLSQKTADYIRNIGELASITGISVEVISSLKVVADDVGVAFTVVDAGMKNFIGTLADAATGSSSAKEKLVRLGIDPQKGINDLESALGKVFKRINDSTNAVDRAKLSQDAFGSSNSALVGVIDSVGGSLEKAKEQASEFGLVLSREGVDAAKRYDKSYQDVKKTLLGVQIAIGEKLLPQIEALFNDTSKSLTQNKKEWRSWGDTIAEVFKATRGFFEFLGQLSKNGGNVVTAFLFARASDAARQARIEQNRNATVDDPKGRSGLVDFGDRKRASRAAEKAAREAKRRREKLARELAAREAKSVRAQIELQKLNISGQKEIFKDTSASLRQGLGEGQFESIEDFQKAFSFQADLLKEAVRESISEISRLEAARLKKNKATKAEIDLAIAQRDARFKGIDKLIKKEAELAKASAKTELLKQEKERLQLLEDIEKTSENRLKTEERITEQKERQTELEIRGATAEKPDLPPETGIDSIFTSFEDVFNTEATGKALETFGVLGAAAQSMGEIFTGVFSSIKQGLASSIEQWIMYGGSVGQAMKQVVVSIIAGVSKLAAFKAIEAAATGFLHLANFNFPAAAVAFKSAALWGVLAVGTALTGRSVAGNSFNGTTSGAGGNDFDFRSNNANQNTQQGSVSSNRLSRQENRIEIALRLPDGWFGTVVQDDVQNSGQGSSIFLNMIEESG